MIVYQKRGGNTEIAMAENGHNFLTNGHNRRFNHKTCLKFTHKWQKNRFKILIFQNYREKDFSFGNEISALKMDWIAVNLPRLCAVDVS